MRLINGECVEFVWTTPLSAQVAEVLRETSEKNKAEAVKRNKALILKAIKYRFDCSHDAVAVNETVFYDTWIAIRLLKLFELDEYTDLAYSRGKNLFYPELWGKRRGVPIYSKRSLAIEVALELATSNLRYSFV